MFTLCIAQNFDCFALSESPFSIHHAWRVLLSQVSSTSIVRSQPANRCETSQRRLSYPIWFGQNRPTRSCQSLYESPFLDLSLVLTLTSIDPLAIENRVLNGYATDTFQPDKSFVS